MPKKLRFEHGSGDSGAVDVYEGLVCPRSGFVYVVCQDFFTAAGRAGNQYGNASI